jgi:hypothetical protein
LANVNQSLQGKASKFRLFLNIHSLKTETFLNKMDRY